MPRRFRCRSRLIVGLALSCAFGAARAFAQSPEASAAKIDFHGQIHPILMRSCGQCHLGDGSKSGFRIDRRDSFLSPAESGRAPAVAGKSGESHLIELLKAEPPALFMPMEGPRLGAGEVALIARWIDEGLEWPEQPAAKHSPPARSLSLRKVNLPPAARPGENGIDRILRAYYKSNKIEPPPPASDAVFARRVWLDANGLLPPPEELAAFEADPSPDKRAALVKKRLASPRQYAEHWISFWNDLLRNDFQGLGFPDSRRQITPWLYSALATNMPYDQLVRALVAPSPESDGFVFGIELAGSALPGETRPMQAAANVSQVFLGANLKCAACHDSFTNQWKLADSFGMGSIFSDAPLELSRCERALGRTAQARFLYPELGGIDPAAPRAERQRQLAAILTDPRNGILPRTIVNRFWARLFGRGLIEPLEDQEAPAWNPELLDWMAGEFIAHNYDMRWLLGLMMTSAAYQAAGDPTGEGSKSEPFRSRRYRRLQSEEFQDALAQATGDWPLRPSVDVDLRAGIDPIEPRRKQMQDGIGQGQWIWHDAATAGKTMTMAKPVRFEKEFGVRGLEANPISAAFMLAYSDASMDVFLNEKEVVKGSPFLFGRAFGVVVRNIRPMVKEGENRFSVEAKPSGEMRGGVFAAVWVKRKNGVEWTVTDPSWRWQELPELGAQPAPGAALADSVKVAAYDAAPWELGGPLINGLFYQVYASVREVRAWRMAPDDLSRALGRPTREQIVARREVEPTRLQGLELLNGDALWTRLRRGASKLLARPWQNPDEMVNHLYLSMLSRKPSAAELAEARVALGAPPSEAGTQDLLWSMAMLPEFNLAR